MTVTIDLPMLMDDSPKWWQNFASNYDGWPETKAALKEWNAKCPGDVSSDPLLWSMQIEFATEQDYLVFLLRWS